MKLFIKKTLLIFFFFALVPFLHVSAQVQVPCGPSAPGQPSKLCFSSAAGLPFVNVPVNTQLLAQYILELNRFFFRLAVVLGVLMVTIGGFQWLIALGNASKISNAKETIEQAVMGLILAFTSVLLLSQIDPSFVELKDLSLQDQLRTLEVTCTDYHSNALCPLRVCSWVCRDPKEQAKPLRPAGVASDPSKEWRDSSCDGSCQSTTSLQAQCSNPQTLAASNNVPYPPAISSDLQTLLNCIMASSAGPLIQQSQIYTFERTNEKCNYTRGNSMCGTCAHKLYSCHYGGQSGTQGSLAADLNAIDGRYEGEQALFKAIEASGCRYGYHEFEDNAGGWHTHISTVSCTNDGSDE